MFGAWDKPPHRAHRMSPFFASVAATWLPDVTVVAVRWFLFVSHRARHFCFRTDVTSWVTAKVFASCCDRFGRVTVRLDIYPFLFIKRNVTFQLTLLMSKEIRGGYPSVFRRIVYRFMTSVPRTTPFVRLRRRPMSRLLPNKCIVMVFLYHLYPTSNLRFWWTLPPDSLPICRHSEQTQSSHNIL